MNTRHAALKRILALALAMVLVPCWVTASQPARDDLFVDMEGTVAIAGKYFPAAQIQEMRDGLTSEIKDRYVLRNPYGEKFVAIGKSKPGFVVIARALSGLRTESCKRDACGSFRKFLAELGKRTRVRAVMSSPRYSGCAEATFEFAEGRRPSLDIKLSSRQFYHCPRTGRRLITSYRVPY